MRPYIGAGANPDLDFRPIFQDQPKRKGKRDIPDELALIFEQARVARCPFSPLEQGMAVSNWEKGVTRARLENMFGDVDLGIEEEERRHRKENRGRVIPKADVDELLDLVRNGMSVLEAAMKTGISYPTALEKAARAGLGRSQRKHSIQGGGE